MTNNYSNNIIYMRFSHLVLAVSISMYVMFILCLFSTWSCRVGTLQFSIIIIAINLINSDDKIVIIIITINLIIIIL